LEINGDMQDVVALARGVARDCLGLELRELV